MSMLNEDTEMVMRPIVHERWKSVLVETIHARQVCGTRMGSNILGTGAIVMINGMSSYVLCQMSLFFISCLLISKETEILKGAAEGWKTEALNRCQLIEKSWTK